MIRWAGWVRLTARGSHEAALSPCVRAPRRRARAPIGQPPYTPLLLSSLVHNHPSLPTEHDAKMGYAISRHSGRLWEYPCIVHRRAAGLEGTRWVRASAEAETLFVHGRVYKG